MKTYPYLHLLFVPLVTLPALDLLKTVFPGLDLMGFYLGVAMVQGLISGVYLERYFIQRKADSSAATSAS